jgi:hypothetical protein
VPTLLYSHYFINALYEIQKFRPHSLRGWVHTVGTTRVANPRHVVIARAAPALLPLQWPPGKSLMAG